VIARTDTFNLQGNTIRKHQAAFLIAHMIMADISLALIRFLVKVYPIFLEKEQVSARDMATAYGCSPQAAGKHIHKLAALGFFERIHYRAWEINSSYLTTLNKM
jgi:hypothetical protein